jgi:hypothetical protein
MKEYLSELAHSKSDPLQARNIVREYLQARILAGLQHAGAMRSLAFHGGTALRFLYAAPRYSEDLDFALERSSQAYDFRTYLSVIRSDLEMEAYELRFKVSDEKIVHSAFVRFPGLLYELGLSSHLSEVISVKIEVDTQPPAGAGLETTLTRRYVVFNLLHHDRASLLAGKLHAILHRPYLKGRDLYDLFWYLSDPEWPSPNLIMLGNALAQTGWRGERPTHQNWRRLVAERLAGVDWSQARLDVRPFLEKQAALEMLTLENLMASLEQPRAPLGE